MRLVSRECACARFPLGGNLSAAPPCRDLSASLLLSSDSSAALPVCACACACGCACGMCGAAGGGGDGPAGGADLARRSARRALHGLSRPPARPRCRWRRRASVCASASGRSLARDETPTASTTAAAKIAAASCIAILPVAPLSSSRRRFPGGASSCSRDARFRLAPEPPPLRRSETGCEPVRCSAMASALKTPPPPILVPAASPSAAPSTSGRDAGIRRSVHAAVNPPSVTFPPPVTLPSQKFQKAK